MEPDNNITIEQPNSSNRNRIFYIAFFVVTVLFAILSARVVFSPQKKDNRVQRDTSSQVTLSSSSSPLSSSRTRGSSSPSPSESEGSPTQLINNQSGISLSLTPLEQTVQINSEFTLNLDFSRLESAPDAIDVILPYSAAMFEFVKAQSSHAGYVLARKLAPKELIILSFVKTGNVLLSDGIVPKDFLRLGQVTLKALKVGKGIITPVYNASSVSTLVSYKDKEGNQLSEVQGITIIVQ